MNKSPLIRLKVPHGLLKLANETNLLNSLIFYYNLKECNIQGSFKNRNFLKFCEARFKMCRNTARKHRNILLKNNLMFEDGEYISLVSYDKLWNFFKVPTHNEKYKIIYTKCENFKLNIICEEIRKNLNDQNYRLRKKYVNRVLEADAVRITSKKIKSRLSKEATFRKNIIKQNEIIRNNLNSRLTINSQVTLTCIGVAKLLGYSSAMQGHYLVQALVKAGKLTSKRQKPLLIRKNVSRAEFNCLSIDSSYFMQGTTLLKFMPNIIQIL
jgi:hypothetical protein